MAEVDVKEILKFVANLQFQRNFDFSNNEVKAKELEHIQSMESGVIVDLFNPTPVLMRQT